VKLLEALELLQRPVADGTPELKVYLACGFTPLHLKTFLAANLRALTPDSRVLVEAGFFGDLIGNLERVQASGISVLVVAIEWSDLDPRLGIRTLGGWRPADMASIVEAAGQQTARLQQKLSEISRQVAIGTVVCLPTLPLPPMFSTGPDQASSSEMQLRATMALFAASLSQQPGIRIVSTQTLDGISPLAGRYDVKSDVKTGFPYTIQHASAVGKLVARLVQLRQPKKGLITDLDDTLWSGILGDDGVDGISWHLDSGTHMHGLYQQFLASLAGAGVLIGVASKNDPAIAKQAFERSDLLLSKDDVFPFETHWSRKSESVQRILKTWNVGADSVVFVDDSPMEVAEVQAAFPEMECVVFPKSDGQAVWELLKLLRDRFGKPALTEEDALRLGSIRDAGAWREVSQTSANSPDDFLKAAEASIVFESARPDGDARAFELINKTNQFNLNGKRVSDSEWRAILNDPAAFVLTVSYKDKYGPLGKIAVVVGKTRGRMLSVSHWVMSCRAFSRRIEYQCLKHLFESMDAGEIVFDYEATPRNGPLQEFFASLLGNPPETGLSLSKENFAARAPQLFHRVEGRVGGRVEERVEGTVNV
jgi:FkbH-like protein